MQKKPLVLYIGVVRQNEFESLMQREIPLGVILDTNSTLRPADLKAFCVVEHSDFSASEDSILHLVDSIQERWPIGCVLVTHERYVLTGALVSEHLGLHGFSKETALVCLDKSIMHERFVQYIGPEATARFKKVASKEELIEFVKKVGFPLILKPTNLYNSLFVSLSQSQEELLQNYESIVHRLADFSQKAGQYHVQPYIQAEEFLQGKTYSIDCIIDAAGNVTTTPVVDMVSGHDMGWHDFHHFARVLPSRLAISEQEAMSDLARAGVQALGIRSSIAHVEIVQTSQGPKLLEIGARPGGNRARMFDLSYGIDLIYAYYQVRLGNKADVTPLRTMPTAVISPYSRKQGMLTNSPDVERIKKLKTYFSHEVKVKPGQIVGPSTLGYTAPLSIELLGDNADELYEDVTRIQSWQDLFVVS